MSAAWGAPSAAGPAPRGAGLVAVLSGKGGVGKSQLATNLAVAAARGGARVLLVDGDLGLANVDVLLNLAPRRDVADFLDAGHPLEGLLVPGPRGIRVLAAASARAELAALRGAPLDGLLDALRRLAAGFDLALVDAAAGLGPSVLGLAAASDRRLLVATPEPASLADAYAALKVMRRELGRGDAELLVNGARDAREARATHARLARLAERFLGVELACLGWVPRDARVGEAAARQAPLVELFPSSPAARHVHALAERLLAGPPAGARP